MVKIYSKEIYLSSHYSNIIVSDYWDFVRFKDFVRFQDFLKFQDFLSFQDFVRFHHLNSTQHIFNICYHGLVTY